MPASSADTLPLRNGPDLWRAALPLRADADHKYTRGACLVWSGPALATGASRLAARAALQIGAGIVTLAGSREALLVHAAHLSAIMLREITEEQSWRLLLAEPRLRSVVIGPAAGLGEPTRQATLDALAAGVAVVIDADALTAFSENPDRLFAAARAAGKPVVLTPHEGEFAALFGAMPGQNREARVLEAAHLSGAIVILKGHHSLIAAPDGRGAINTNAPATLATAGSGDILAGLLGGLLAQGMPGFEAACAAVWLHGEIGRRAGHHPIADDFIAAIRALPGFGAL
ncbi:MAG: hypothetical protein FD175_1472 [Beijerinckiaceae bacterium]|nr:MAG: hypothetical protein FD175_1472 [Beijerinckiaceae bacterium]